MKLIAVLVALAAVASGAGPRQVAVSDALYWADGSKMSATVVFSWSAFESVDGYLVAAGSKAVGVVGGVFAAVLLPTPAGVTYRVEWISGRGVGERSVEYWSVPDVATCRLVDVTRSATPSGGLPVPPLLLLLSQLDRGGAVSGEVLTWTGGSWAPRGGCASYTAVLSEVTLITIPASTHGLGAEPVRVDCWDAQSPRHLVEADAVVIDEAGAVTITFAVAQSGSCVLRR